MNKDDWLKTLDTKKKKYIILFVCSGNIMRSPYAELMAKAWIRKNAPQYKEDVEFRSGAVIWQNQRIHPQVASKLEENGISKIQIKNHKPRLLENFRAWFDEADLIIGMTDEHKDKLTDFYPKKSFLFGKVAVNQITDVLDPYFHQMEENTIFNQLDQYIESFCTKIITFLSNKDNM